jgi:fungal STAND N-terminal Goodbye domain
MDIIESPLANESLKQLWINAVEEYKRVSSLSTAQEALLAKCQSPEEVFDVTKVGWKENIQDKQGRHSGSIQQAVSRTLGVFDMIDCAVGFAFPPATVVTGAVKVLLQVSGPILHVSLISKTAQNLWDVYDMIANCFLEIEGFFGRVSCYLQDGSIPGWYQDICTRILVSVLKICGVATSYAKKGSLKKCSMYQSVC